MGYLFYATSYAGSRISFLENGPLFVCLSDSSDFRIWQPDELNVVRLGVAKKRTKII